RRVRDRFRLARERPACWASDSAPSSSAPDSATAYIELRWRTRSTQRRRARRARRQFAIASSTSCFTERSKLYAECSSHPFDLFEWNDEPHADLLGRLWTDSA